MDGLRYRLTLRLYRADKSFGPGPMRLMQGVRATGSLQQAADQMGMAYSKAWKTLRQAERELGFALLVRHSGGAHGGGSALTEQGRAFLERYEAMVREVDQAAEAAFQKYFPE
ncbi:LysR family transcriptional regulator [Butyricicoccus faecihominis]|uniref:winged helix-turn-helix domain-containing protein n=1 Tax=Butyricicoccus faecihominis TaxID=1712515 RepID=UPI00247A84D0|nr:LysR family transcriptional regulator [Butyricicoccus faecihominis]MCQ5128745.1 LysR family transcriptional regulator [Butyricicoccus faecihominis]